MLDDPDSGAINACKEWDDLFQQARDWAEQVVYVDEHSDYWESLRAVPGVLAGPAEPGEAALTADDRSEIARRTGEIKSQARENPELTAEQIRGIQQKLDDLVGASGRVGKKNWLIVLYGAAFGMIANDLAPPHVVRGIITTVISGLRHIFGVGGAHLLCCRRHKRCGLSVSKCDSRRSSVSVSGGAPPAGCGQSLRSTIRTSSTRELMASLVNTFLRCPLTVWGEMKSRAATSRLVSPSATSSPG